MSLQHCEWCYTSPFLRETYGDDLLERYRFYLGDSEDFPVHPDPKMFVAGMIRHDKNEISLRRRLEGRTKHIYVSRDYNINGKEIHFEGLIPIKSIEKTAAHELEHALDCQERSESKIDQRALDKYIDFYVRKEIEASLKDAEVKTKGYIV